MSPSPNNGVILDSDPLDPAHSGEDTLRLIASLPAPEGLADRVRTGLRSAPQTASPAGRVLRWRGPLDPTGGWMHSGVARGAAAAAIVCVVAGGGWMVYSRVSPAPTAKVLEMPQRIGPAGGGFAPAGAKRLPETLQGPVLTHPITNPPDQPVADKAPDESRPVSGAKKKRPGPKTAAAPAP